MEPVQIVGMRPVWGLASPSPFCLKLETWLRIAAIPYRPIILEKLPQSKTKKIPYLLLENGDTLADSSHIIAHLARERGIDLVRGRTTAEMARSHAIQRLVEESLYFVAVWERWIMPEGWRTAREAYFGPLPAGVRGLVAGLVRRHIRTALHGQGMLRRAPASIAAYGAADIAALSALLGDQPLFDGTHPGIADAAAYGLLANLLAFPVHTPLKSAVLAHPNLVAFCRRIEAAYWPAGV